MQTSIQYDYNPRGFKEEIPNFSYITSLVGNDFAFRSKFLAIIKNEFPEECEKYLFHIGENEPRAASEFVRKLKYRISALGMNWAYDLADKYEERLHLGDSSLDKEFRRILKKIVRFLKNI